MCHENKLSEIQIALTRLKIKLPIQMIISIILINKNIIYNYLVQTLVYMINLLQIYFHLTLYQPSMLELRLPTYIGTLLIKWFDKNTKMKFHLVFT